MDGGRRSGGRWGLGIARCSGGGTRTVGGGRGESGNGTPLEKARLCGLRGGGPDGGSGLRAPCAGGGLSLGTEQKLWTGDMLRGRGDPTNLHRGGWLHADALLSLLGLVQLFRCAPEPCPSSSVSPDARGREGRQGRPDNGSSSYTSGRLELKHSRSWAACWRWQSNSVGRRICGAVPHKSHECPPAQTLSAPCTFGRHHSQDRRFSAARSGGRRPNQAGPRGSVEAAGHPFECILPLLRVSSCAHKGRREAGWDAATRKASHQHTCQVLSALGSCGASLDVQVGKEIACHPAVDSKKDVIVGHPIIGSQGQYPRPRHCFLTLVRALAQAHARTLAPSINADLLDRRILVVCNLSI
eukprot:1746186-Prymnesium_polylepis.3